MGLKVTYILLISAALVGQLVTGCNEGFHRFLDSCYKYVESPILSQAAAKTACEGLNSHLVSVQTMAESGYLLDSVQAINNTSIWYWTAGKEIAEGDYVWDDGTNTPVDHSIWLNGEPNNALGTQDAIRIWYQRSIMTWGFDDFQMARESGYICELESPRQCNEGFERFQDSCYKYVRTPELSQSEAKAACRGQGSHLVSVQTNAEAGYLLDSVQAINSSSTWYWTAGTEIEEGDYVWDDGTDEPVAHSIWLDGEPNNFLGTQDAIRIWFKRKIMTWGFDDFQKARQSGYICEYEL